MKISHKLKGIFSVLVILLLIIVVINYWTFINLETDSNFINNSGRLRAISFKMAQLAGLIVFENDQQAITDLKDRIHFFEDTLVNIETGNESLGLKPLSHKDTITRLEDVKQTWVSEFKPAYEKVLISKDVKALHMISNQVDSYVQALDALVTGYSDYSNNKVEQAKMMNWIFLSIAVVFVVVFSILLNRAIFKPLQSIVLALRKISKGDTDILLTYKSNNEIGQVSKAIEKVAVTIDELIEESEMLTYEAKRGALTKRGNVDKFEGVYKDILDGIHDVMDTLVGHIDAIPVTITLLDAEFNILHVNKTALKMLDASSDQLIGQKCYDFLCSEVCNKDRCPGRATLEKGKSTSVEAIAKEKDLSIETVPVQDGEGHVIGMIEVIVDQTEIKKVQREAENSSQAMASQMQVANKQSEYQKKEVSKLIVALAKLAKGQLDIDTYVEDADADTRDVREDFKNINNSLEASVNTIKSYIIETTDILEAVADKDFTLNIERNYLGDFSALRESINFIIAQFNTILTEINKSATQVETGAEQVAATGQTLSDGASQQASSVEEISSIVTEVTEQTKQNAENANKASDLSLEVKIDAQRGSDEMVGMLSAMDAIKDSSKSISSVIKVIDDIAFQTNILALNAAVEAARAGEHGKGFAVVAEEVRNLAARSAKAAKETTELIDNSINKVDDGYEIAHDTAEALKKIMTGVTNAVEVLGTIAEASAQQAEAITQIDSGVTQISEVTQTNTATAEESASASEEMAGQAHILKNMINAFQLKGSQDSNYQKVLTNNNHDKLEHSFNNDDLGKY